MTAQDLGRRSRTQCTSQLGLLWRAHERWELDQGDEAGANRRASLRSSPTTHSRSLSRAGPGLLQTPPTALDWLPVDAVVLPRRCNEVEPLFP